MDQTSPAAAPGPSSPPDGPGRRFHDLLDGLGATHAPCPDCGGCLTCRVHWDPWRNAYTNLSVPDD